VLLAAAGAGLLVQGLAASVHSGQVLARPDTRATTRAFLTRAVPETTVPGRRGRPAGAAGHPRRGGARGPQRLVARRRAALAAGPTGNRWVKFPTARDEAGRPVGIEDYVRTLHPGLLDRYEAEGFCWVVTGSTQRGRAEADPEAVPRAVAYYRELDRRGKVVHVSSPYREGAEPVPFNFDWSFDHYPRAYARPGPVMTVLRLRGGRCAGAAPGGRPATPAA
jgi:hypothetical protein